MAGVEAMDAWAVREGASGSDGGGSEGSDASAGAVVVDASTDAVAGAVVDTDNDPNPVAPPAVAVDTNPCPVVGALVDTDTDPCTAAPPPAVAVDTDRGVWMPEEGSEGDPDEPSRCAGAASGGCVE